MPLTDPGPTPLTPDVAHDADPDLRHGPWRSLSIEREIIPPDATRWEHPPSEHFTILALLRGSLRYEWSDERNRWSSGTGTTGDACRIPPGSAAALRLRSLPPGALEQARIRLSPEVLERHVREEAANRLVDLQSLRRITSRSDPLIISMATTLLSARESGAGQLYADSAAQYLAAHLLAPRHRPSDPPGTLSRRQLDIVVSYMRAHLAERIGLDDLAREVSISRFHFLRLFSAATGRTPHRFLTGLRVEEARRLLETGHTPVGEVGRLCGFGNAGHFAAVFRRYTGQAPTAYRRNSRKDSGG
jgi:AraC family transcriptional regulator